MNCMLHNKSESFLFARADDFEVETIRAMYASALSVGLPIVSMDKCCQLLAWLYVYGGGNEATVFNAKFRYAVLYAQHRMNLFGGETPNGEWLPVLQEYIKEAESDCDRRMAARRDDEKYITTLSWIKDIEKTYNITTRA